MALLSFHLPNAGAPLQQVQAIGAPVITESYLLDQGVLTSIWLSSAL